MIEVAVDEPTVPERRTAPFSLLKAAATESRFLEKGIDKIGATEIAIGKLGKFDDRFRELGVVQLARANRAIR